MSSYKSGVRIAIDIGSTVIKFALIAENNSLVWQHFHARDFEAGIERQVRSLLESLDPGHQWDEIAICSSANGGLRIGILCLSKDFSGAVLRHQALLAGANPVFVRDFDEDGATSSYVDMLLVGGGIDCEDADPLETRLRNFDLEGYRYGRLIYAGNRCLAEMFCNRFPNAMVVPNPIGQHLVSTSDFVFELIRRAYLDDLVYKEGVSELGSHLSTAIRPTPEVVNSGFQRIVMNRSSMAAMSPCVLLDIGGATTDLHYMLEIIKDNSPIKVSSLRSSVARYVFTDLGIVASRESLILQLRSHSRLYELMKEVVSEDVTENYRLFREGEYDPSPAFLSYGCLFIALERFIAGRGPGLPSADLHKVAQLILTGGGAQVLSESVAARVVGLLLPANGSKPSILIDRPYRIWVEGMVWSERVVAATVE